VEAFFSLRQCSACLTFQAFPNPFFIYNFILYYCDKNCFILQLYSCDKNCLILSIFISVLLLSLLLLLLLLWLLLLLFYVLKHAKCYKFEFVTFDITINNYLYWILNVEIHLDAVGLGDTIKERNKASEQLICSCGNNIVKRDFTNILNLFHVFVWLNKTMKLLMKTHEICPTGSAPFLEVNTIIFLIYIFMVIVVALVVVVVMLGIMIMDMVIKNISKIHFIIRSGTIMWKRKKKKVKIMANKMKVYVIIMVVEVMSCTCHTPKHVKNNEKNIETHIAYKDGNFDHGHLDATHLWYCYFLC